jgi:beta-glucanase (GH16 family)
MRTRILPLLVFLVMITVAGCQTGEELNSAGTPSELLKAAAVDILNYDNFNDHMEFNFTNVPTCPLIPDAWTRCGNSDNGRWARLSWNWSACPISPFQVTTAQSNLLMEVPGDYKWLGGQIESQRNDYGYGRYRARIKAGAHSGSSTQGTCSAFFFYNSATTQEIDVEILNREDKKVHFVTHPGDNQIIYTLPFDPASDYIEYGFDWYKGRIDFFVNGTKVTPSQTRSVPSVRGTIMLNHWTGNSGWSGTPQPLGSIMAVDYVKHTPFLLITYPDQGGLTWPRGTARSITWDSYGDMASNMVNIEIWKGGKLYKTIASRITNTGSYSFTVPASYPVANSYRIKIKSVLSAEYYDFSNADFSII